MPFDGVIAQIVTAFQAAPHDSFHERELHALFFCLARQMFGHAQTRDGYQVCLLRHEYETIWLYRKRNEPEPFSVRYPELIQRVPATTGCFDFALLLRTFVEGNVLLTVINKSETSRARLRSAPGQAWPANQTSVAIEAAVEFKMAHRQWQFDVAQGQINQLRNGMLLDCRKLARERVPSAYVLGFSHGPGPSQGEATGILDACQREFLAKYDGPPAQCSLQAIIATPSDTYLSGSWTNSEAMPGYARR
jgi:hypothetical protein